MKIVKADESVKTPDSTTVISNVKKNLPNPFHTISSNPSRTTCPREEARNAPKRFPFGILALFAGAAALSLAFVSRIVRRRTTPADNVIPANPDIIPAKTEIPTGTDTKIPDQVGNSADGTLLPETTEETVVPTFPIEWLSYSPFCPFVAESETVERTIGPMPIPKSETVEISPLHETADRIRTRLEHYRTFVSVARAKGLPPPDESDVRSDETLFGSVTVRLGSIGGSFPVTFSQTPEGSVLSVKWIEDENQRFERAFRFSESEIPSERFERWFSKRIDRLMLLAMAERERVKQREFREIRRLRVSKKDLSRIRDRLEAPEVLVSGNETGGFWFGSPYSVKNGEFVLSGLELPNPGQERATPVSHELDISFFRDAYRDRMGIDFSEYERSLAVRLVRRSGVGASGHPLLGFCRGYNWHKHPGGPIPPSDGDLNDSAAEPAAMYSGTSLATLYAIANPFRGETPPVAGWPNAIVLPSGKNGRNYFLTFWKVLKILPEEAERRLRTSREVGKIQSVAAGILSMNGALRHLGKAVELNGVKFGPDLVPVDIRIDGA